MTNKVRKIKFNHYIYNTYNILPILSIGLLVWLAISFIAPNSNGNIGHNAEVVYAADANNPNKTTPTASLTVSNSGTQEINVQPNSGTIYSSHKVTIDSVNITNYALSISGPATLSSVSGKTTITGANGASGNSLPDNTWGYNYNTSGITNESNYGSSNYSSFSGSTQTLESANGSPSSIERSLVLAAKFGDTAEPGHYAGQVNLSLTAVPKVLTTYSITYNANSGSGAPSNWSDTSYDDSYTTSISSTTPTRSGYTFLGWNTSSTATSANSNYAAGKSITLQSSSPTLNLYAIWKAQGPQTFTLSFDANGGTGAPNQQSCTTANADDISCNITIPTTMPTRSGYDFLGWSNTKNTSTTTATASTDYSPGKTNFALSDSSPNTLYAVWRTKISTSSGFSSITNMQQMTSTICSNATRGATKTLTDARTGNYTYTVTKLADGKCWMTQNLRLAGGTVLTSVNSNVSSNYTLPASTDIFADPDPTLGQMMNSTDNTKGAYYSYNAATAGTKSSATSGSSTYDICPLGWRLPTRAEYIALSSALGANNDPAGNAMIRNTPNNFVYTGYVSSSGLISVDTHGRYWSSTISDATFAYGLRFDKNNLLLFGNNYYRYLGFPVRCVAK